MCAKAMASKVMRSWLYVAGLSRGIMIVASQCYEGGWFRRHVFSFLYLYVRGFGFTNCCLNLLLFFGFLLY
jgi:hypothetical protein